MAEQFDPFNNRQARDLRNSLSSAFITTLIDPGDGGHAPLNQAVQKWRTKELPEHHRQYLQQTQIRYQQVLRDILSQAVTDRRQQALILWNAGLFFEMHELLETIWHAARGSDRIALKGLIQAAGAYVHSSRGQMRAAQGLARRARRNLETGRSGLCFISNLDQLLDQLTDLVAPPPELHHGGCEPEKD